MMKSKLMMLVLLGVIVTFGGTALAAMVPNGDFALYNSATGSRSATVTGDIWVGDIGAGANRPIKGGTVTFEDSTSLTTGGLVDVPGWITPILSANGNMTNAADLFSSGVDPLDGTGCLNAFGAWSGGAGVLAMTDASLVLPGGIVTISAMFQGDPLPITFDLLVDGVALIPDAATNPADPGGGAWRELSRTYNTVPAGDARILIGVPNGVLPEGGHTLTGTRLKIDNVSIVPEPATMALLGLSGLALLRRRRRA